MRCAQAEAKAKQAETKAKQAETKAKQAETKAKQAETKARKADARAAEAEERARAEAEIRAALEQRLRRLEEQRGPRRPQRPRLTGSAFNGGSDLGRGRNRSMNIAKLALEDGTVFTGKAFGARGESDGEVVFNTSMTGYQEILTDPSYHGQIVAMTYPQIGNYGVNARTPRAGGPGSAAL